MLRQRERESMVDDAGEVMVAERRHRTTEVSPGRWITAAVAAVLGVFGVVALLRAGVDASLERPVVDVAGIGHSAVVGLVELLAAVLLLLSSADETTRPLGGFVGALLVVGGVVVAAAGPSLRQDLGLTPDVGWLLAVCGVIVLAATLMGRAVRTDRTTVVR